MQFLAKFLKARDTCQVRFSVIFLRYFFTIYQREFLIFQHVKFHASFFPFFFFFFFSDYMELHPVVLYCLNMFVVQFLTKFLGARDSCQVEKFFFLRYFLTIYQWDFLRHINRDVLFSGYFFTTFVQFFEFFKKYHSSSFLFIKHDCSAISC